jgi:hypothetical protein
MCSVVEVSVIFPASLFKIKVTRGRVGESTYRGFSSRPMETRVGTIASNGPTETVDRKMSPEIMK